MSSLRKSLSKGIFWSYFDSFGTYLIKFGFSIAIARVLSPEDYGTIGMIVIFIALGQILMTGGFAMALVQKTEINERDQSTVFWYNLAMATAVYIVLFLTSGLIADFYGSPVLKNVTRVSALSIVLSSLICVPVALLTRQMDFKRQALINLFAALFSGIAGVIFAYNGLGVWALVIQTLASNLVATAGFWIISKWSPRFIFDRGSFITMNRFGYKIFLQGLGDVIFTKLYYPLIGKYFSASSLGYYTNANRFYEIFVRQVTNSFTRVMFPAFSSIQDETGRVHRNYLLSFEVLFYLASVLTLILILAARPFVSIFLTEKWLPAVPLMTVFFIEGAFFPLLMLNHNLLNSLGKSGLSLRLDILKKVLTFGSIFIAFRYGVRALIIGQVVASFISFVFSVFVMVCSQKIDLRGLIKPVLLTVFITAICTAAYYLLIMRTVSEDWILLVTAVMFIPALFIILSVLLKARPFQELKSITQNFLISDRNR